MAEPGKLGELSLAISGDFFKSKSVKSFVDVRRARQQGRGMSPR